MATRSSRASLLAIGMFTNRVMVGTVGVVAGLQIAARHAPFLSTSLGAGLALVLATEVEKWWLRRWNGWPQKQR